MNLPATQQPVGLDPERLTSADDRARLESLIHSPLVARGCVVIIGIDAIRDRLDGQWCSKRDMVWETVGRILDRKLAPPALWARASEVDYVVCASDNPAASRGLALKLLREILEFFLGVQRFEDMRIAAVLSISEDFELACARLDPQALSQSQDATGQDLSSAARPNWNALSFAIPGDEALEAEFHRERIVNLRNGATIATRLWTRLRNKETGHYLGDGWPERLSASSLGVVNAATVHCAKTLYGASSFGVFLSASIHTLAHNRNRAEIVQHLERVQVDPARPIIVELLDIDRGTPQGRIEEVVGMLAPHCRKVLVRATIDPVPIELLQSCRLSGLSLDCDHLQREPRDFLLRFARFAEAARQVSPLIFALNLHGQAARELALLAGATHGGCSTAMH